MTATVAGIHLGLDTHANRPAANTAPDGSFYSCSTHGLIYKSNFAGNSWATWATLGGTETLPVTIIDAKGDLIVGTAADTAARLAVGANGDYPRAASGASTGIEWQKNNLAASAAPTTGDDSGDGYSVGSRWIDTTNDKEYVCLDASVGAAVWTETTAAGGGGDFAPWLVDIIATISAAASHTNWNTLTNYTDGVTYPFVLPGGGAGASALQSSSAQNDQLTWKPVLSAGTWNARILCRKSSNTGIFTLKIAGSSVGTADSYNGGGGAYGDLAITGFSVAADGAQDVQLIMATKNGSSSDYYGELFGLSLRRTA